jgi:hypothetical protein
MAPQHENQLPLLVKGWALQCRIVLAEVTVIGRLQDFAGFFQYTLAPVCFRSPKSCQVLPGLVDKVCYLCRAYLHTRTSRYPTYNLHLMKIKNRCLH